MQFTLTNSPFAICNSWILQKEFFQKNLDGRLITREDLIPAFRKKNSFEKSTREDLIPTFRKKNSFEKFGWQAHHKRGIIKEGPALKDN